MAGDLSARIFREPTADEEQKACGDSRSRSRRVRSTWVTETISMASVPPDPVPLLVSLKAVDPSEYPYYGTAELEPAMSLQQALQGDSAVVADEFLIRLNAHVGDTLRLGGRNFKITAVLKQEPDRMTAGAGLGPRVMISQAALDADGPDCSGQPREPAAAGEAARADGGSETAVRKHGGSGAARCAGDGFQRRESGAEPGAG